MKTLKSIFAALVIVSFASVSVSAQSTSEVSDADASATIIAPISLSNTVDLEFGKIVRSTGGGNVVITAAEEPTRTPSGDLTFISGDTWSPATFIVNADDNQAFSITKPNTITLNGPTSSTMVITTNISGATTGVTTTSGLYTFYIGGSLAVGATQTIGDYSAVYEVTVQYE